jgi:uncharacterized protein YigE (DUF2233 family)
MGSKVRSHEVLSLFVSVPTRIPHVLRILDEITSLFDLEKPRCITRCCFGNREAYQARKVLLWVQEVISSQVLRIFLLAFTALTLGSSLSGATPASPVKREYTVQPKETLYRFGLRCGQSLEVLRRANKLSNNTVYVGQRIHCASSAILSRPAVGFTNGTVAGVKVSIIRINLSNPAVRLGLLVPRSGIAHGGERLERMYARSGAIAAINGGFFNTKTYAPVGDIVANKRLLARGQLRTAFTISLAGRARVIDWNDGNQRTAQHSSNRWRGFSTVIGNGPHIISNGVTRIRIRTEGYRDLALLNANARSAIGLINDREIVLVSTSQKISLEQLARVLQKLGTREALVLDGGSSTGMVWRGKTVVKSLRRISYGIAVFGP